MYTWAWVYDCPHQLPCCVDERRRLLLTSLYPPDCPYRVLTHLITAEALTLSRFSSADYTGKVGNDIARPPKQRCTENERQDNASIHHGGNSRESMRAFFAQYRWVLCENTAQRNLWAATLPTCLNTQQTWLTEYLSTFILWNINIYHERATIKATAIDLRFHPKELLDSVNRGEEVVITFRGKPCAKLVPPPGNQKTTGKMNRSEYGKIMISPRMLTSM